MIKSKINILFIFIISVFLFLLLGFGVIPEFNNYFTTIASAELAMAHSLYISNGNFISPQVLNTLRVFYGSVSRYPHTRICLIDVGAGHDTLPEGARLGGGRTGEGEERWGEVD